MKKIFPPTTIILRSRKAELPPGGPAALRRSRLLAVAAGALALGAGGVRAETLADAIALAYQSNPGLQAQRAALRATDETYVQARAGYEPTASVQASVTTGDNTLFSSTAGTPIQGPGAVQSSSATLTLAQPLYTGGRVASAVDAADATVRAGREALRATEQSVLQNVINAYVAVRRDQAAVAIAQENVALLVGQLNEINARHKVGEITRTDVAQTQQRVSAGRAQLATAQANLSVSRATYAQVVGQSPGELAPEPPLNRLLPVSFEAAVDAAVARNPQLRQADYAERASAARIAEARAQTRPTLALQGSLSYAGNNVGLSTPFARYGHDVSASLVATLPLSTGGVTSSQIRQAAETNAVDRLGIENARRQAVFSVSQAWSELVGARESLLADQEQVDAAKDAFEGSRTEGKLGLRTSLDVLISEQDLNTAQLALIGARHDEYVAASGLLAAMGELTAEALSPGVTVYNPVKNFDRVRHMPLQAPWEPVVAAMDGVAAPSTPPPPAKPK